MTSDKFRATNLNKQPPISNEGDSVRDHLLRAILVGLLALTGFIHWALPIGHPMIRPGELTGGILLIPHNVLHLLFNLNGVGYFALVACVAGWIPLAARHKPMLYPI